MSVLYTKEYLDEKCADCREKADAFRKADMYRRQLGGANAAHARRKKELEAAKAENAKLRSLVLSMHMTLKLSAEIPATVSSLETTERMMRELGFKVDR